MKGCAFFSLHQAQALEYIFVEWRWKVLAALHMPKNTQIRPENIFHYSDFDEFNSVFTTPSSILSEFRFTHSTVKRDFYEKNCFCFFFLSFSMSLKFPVELKCCEANEIDLNWHGSMSSSGYTSRLIHFWKFAYFGFSLRRHSCVYVCKLCVNVCECGWAVFFFMMMLVAHMLFSHHSSPKRNGYIFTVRAHIRFKVIAANSALSIMICVHKCFSFFRLVCEKSTACLCRPFSFFSLRRCKRVDMNEKRIVCAVCF